MSTEENPAADNRSRRSGGRPTKYKPAYCNIAVELGRQGLSLTHIACEFGTTKDVLADWARDHPEFSSAMGAARELSEMWWIDKGTEGMLAGPGSFNATIWSRSMAARFPETWREKRVRVDIPDVVDNSTLIQAQAKVSAAIASGKLDTEGGTVLSKLLIDLGTSMERLEIEKRLAAIEERLGKR